MFLGRYTLSVKWRIDTLEAMYTMTKQIFLQSVKARRKSRLLWLLEPGT